MGARLRGERKEERWLGMACETLEPGPHVKGI